jgi:hypothetical protein
MFVFTGCLYIPVKENEVVSGKKISDDQLLLIQPGVTTKKDIITQLGEPDVFWVDECIFTYNWEMHNAIMPYVFATPAGGGFGIIDFDKDYVLLIQFDQNDYVKRFELTTRSLFEPHLEPYGEHLKEWVEEGREPTSSDNSQQPQ